MQIKRREIASLDVVEVAHNNREALVVIILHGYGASAHDLFPLHEQMNLASSRDLSWYFPNGFVKVPIAPNIYGRAWFPLSVSSLQENIASEEWESIASFVPEGLDEARKRVESFIAQLIHERQITSKQIVIGGFSQGAMLATDLCLRAAIRKENFAALLLLSGIVINLEEWSKQVLELKDRITSASVPTEITFSFFQSHGYQDPILPFLLAEKLQTLLQQASWRGPHVFFAGGHDIPQQVILGMQQFINSL